MIFSFVFVLGFMSNTFENIKLVFSMNEYSQESKITRLLREIKYEGDVSTGYFWRYTNEKVFIFVF